MTADAVKRALALREAEQRRPGITAIQDEIRKAHPNWSEKTIAGEAKITWTSRRAREVANAGSKRPGGSTGNAP